MKTLFVFIGIKRWGEYCAVQQSSGESVASVAALHFVEIPLLIAGFAGN